MNPQQQALMLKQNKHLRQQLRQANFKIHELQEQVKSLQERLNFYQNQQTTVHQLSQSSQEVFTQSSNDSRENESFSGASENSALQANSPDKIMVGPSKITSIHRISSNLEKSPRVIFNYNQEAKKPNTILQSRQPNKKFPDFHMYSSEKKQIKTNHHHEKNQQHSTNQPKRNSMGLFQKVKTSKKVFQTFFITGFSLEKMSPIIQFYFPQPSMHFEALLNLMYSESNLKVHDSLEQISKSPKYTGKIGKYRLKDTFVIPLRKGEKQEKQYIVACQVEDYMETNDKILYSFSRMFCFITQCNFFGAFKQISEQFIQKINSKKGNFFALSPLPVQGINSYLRNILQEHLQILWSKNIENNQYANFGLGDQIKVFIDIPSEQNSHKALNDFNSWEIFSLKISMLDKNGKHFRQNFLGFLVVYFISQAKVLLYSSSKSKISEAIMHLTEFIKPLQYVNPIIISAIREQHQQYLNAPMPLTLGLWSEPKNKKKQKIEIFVNRKNNLCGLIQEGKLNFSDGIVFNLDTGYTFGQGITEQKNQLAIYLNSFIGNECKGLDTKYKIFQKIFKKYKINDSQTTKLSQNLIKCIENTQLYNYFKENNNQFL